MRAYINVKEGGKASKKEWNQILSVTNGDAKKPILKPFIAVCASRPNYTKSYYAQRIKGELRVCLEMEKGYPVPVGRYMLRGAGMGKNDLLLVTILKFNIET